MIGKYGIVMNIHQWIYRICPWRNSIHDLL